MKLRQRRQRRCNLPVAKFACECERFFKTGSRGGQIALREMSHTQRLQGSGDSSTVPDFARYRQAFLQRTLRVHVVAHYETELPQIEQPATPGKASRLGAGTRERFDRHAM